MKARKRSSSARRGALALIFAFATLAACLKVLVLPVAGTRTLTAFEPRPDYLDRPHRHQVAPSIPSAAR